MKTFVKYIAIFLLVNLVACTDFIDVKPKGILSDAQLNDPSSIDALVISAYAFLANDHYSVPNQLWPWGDLRAGDAYKGGDGPADISIFHAMEIFSTILPNMSTYAPSVLGDLNNKKWERQYIGISRVNNALARINEIDENDYPLKNQRAAELRFLRGHYFFDLKILYKYIPWFDENASAADISEISNTEYTNDELWQKMADDFQFAVTNLPKTQQDAGRPNQYTAMAYLAKVKLYQAYEQDESNKVVSMNTDLLEEVVDLVSEIETDGPFSLEADFGFPFLWEMENGPEAVWQIQRSYDDGTSTGNVDFSNMLNSPMNTEFGCCWFHIPSQNLANSFKTDAQGLPMFDAFNDTDIDIVTDNVDPRLDHTIAMIGKPWKYSTDYIYDINWTRQPGIYGEYSSIKESVSPDCPCVEHMPPFVSNSKNTILIRYSDVLLWKAEALIELGRQVEALPIINLIRTRAANSTQMLIDALDQPLSNYDVQTYSVGNWTQDYARNALRWERRLELALEGHRYFDLVRWGVAKETVDTYLEIEKTKREYLQDAAFEESKHEYMPIPQQQIDLSKGLYEQNKGYK